MEKEISYDQLQHAFEILQELDGFRKMNQHCDFVLKVESEEIPVHRNILCANSEYFKAMLSHDTVENQSGIVEFKDMNNECSKICADFMYGKKISISKQKWEDLMHCADRLQLHKLRTFLEKLFLSTLALDSFYDIRGIANTYSCKELTEACDKFAPENFYAISQLDEFAHLEKDYVVLLVTSELNKASEAIKMKALLDWVRSDLHNRSKFLFEMIKNINLSQLPKTHVRYLIEKDLVTSQSLDCVRILSSSVMDSFGVSPSTMDYVLNDSNCVAVFDDNSRHLQCFNPTENTWRQMQSFHPDMKEDAFSAIALNDHIYALMKDKSVHRLKYADPNATWHQMADMIDGHGRRPPSIKDSRYIYILGCSDSGEMSSKVVEKYDTIADNWEYVTQFKAAPCSSCVLLKRRIYCIGGKENNEEVCRVQILDLDSNNWISATPLPYGGIYFGSTTHLGKIYVAGGQYGDTVLSRVECYDPENSSWISLLPIPRARTVLPVITIGDSIFAIGGYKSQKSHVNRYDIKNNMWTKIEVRNMKTLWCVGLNIDLEKVRLTSTWKD